MRYWEFGGCPLFGSRKCTASTGIAVGTFTVVRYSEEVRYWEGPLSEVPLYFISHNGFEGRFVHKVRMKLLTYLLPIEKALNLPFCYPTKGFSNSIIQLSCTTTFVLCK